MEDLQQQVTFGPSSQTFRHMFKGLSEDLQTCIDRCSLAQQICEQALTHVMVKEDVAARSSLLRNLLDCAEICATSLQFMLRQSPLHPRICAVCADICRECIKACEDGGEDEVLKNCIEACRACAESCDQMANGAH